MARDLLTLEDSILGLDRFDDIEQALKDKIHQRLQDNSELEPSSGCMLYLGFWEDNGQAKMRVGRKVRNLARVAAWLYIPGFRLHGPERAVRTCDTPACWNHEHLRVVLDQAEAARRQRERGLLGNSSNRLNRARAEELREFLAGGGTLAQAAVKFGIGVKAARAVRLGQTWPKREDDAAIE